MLSVATAHQVLSARRSQIPSEDLAFDEPWVVVDVLLKPGIELPDLNIQMCDPARPMTYVRTPRDIRRWEIMMLPGESAEEMTSPDRIWSFIEPWLTPDQGTIWRAAAYRFHALVADALARAAACFWPAMLAIKRRRSWRKG